MPGVAVMTTPLPPVKGPWLLGSEWNEDGAPIPGQVAEKLEGQSFPTFKAFREAFWNAVVATTELREQFNDNNRQRMRDGNAPFAPDPDPGTGERGGVWELHHAPDIGKGGPVYDLSTIRVVTPNQHDTVHHGRK